MLAVSAGASVGLRVRLDIGLGVDLGGVNLGSIDLGLSLRVSLFLRLFDHRRPFGGGLLHHGFLGDAPGLDPRGREITDRSHALRRFGVRRRFGFGLGFVLRVGGRYRSGRRIRARLAHDVVVDDVGPDDGRSHRGKNVHRKFLQVTQHSGHSRALFDAGTLRHIQGSTATDRWQLAVPQHRFVFPTG